jgi:hypothetical protein
MHFQPLVRVRKCAAALPARQTAAAGTLVLALLCSRNRTLVAVFFRRFFDEIRAGHWSAMQARLRAAAARRSHFARFEVSQAPRRHCARVQVLFVASWR